VASREQEQEREQELEQEQEQEREREQELEQERERERERELEQEQEREREREQEQNMTACAKHEDALLHIVVEARAAVCHAEKDGLVALRNLADFDELCEASERLVKADRSLRIALRNLHRRKP
jgi:hypothetical protein